MKKFSDYLSLQRWKVILGSLRGDVRAAGAAGAAKLLSSQILTILMKDFGFARHPWIYSIRFDSLACPLLFRAYSSDPYTIRQVLVSDEHKDILHEKDVQLVVDCGANIGCASVRFLSAYREATVVSIEPDPANFAILKQNLKPYGSRAVALQAAVWNLPGEKVNCSRGNYRDGLDWATTVSKTADGSGDTMTVSLDDILAKSGHEKIDILKIDIEGAERVLFESNYKGWLAQTRNLCIELHGEACERAFWSAMEDFAFERSHDNELVICRNIEAAPLRAI